MDRYPDPMGEVGSGPILAGDTNDSCSETEPHPSSRSKRKRQSEDDGAISADCHVQDLTGKAAKPFERYVQTPV